MVDQVYHYFSSCFFDRYAVFKYDGLLKDAISTLRISKDHAKKLKDFQSRLRGEFSNKPGDMPTAIIDPRAKAISIAAKAVVYVALYFVVEATLKKLLLWTNTDKRIKRANLVQQTQEVWIMTMCLTHVYSLSVELKDKSSRRSLAETGNDDQVERQAAVSEGAI